MDKIEVIRKHLVDDVLFEIRYNHTLEEFAMFKNGEMLYCNMSSNKVDDYWDNYFNTI